MMRASMCVALAAGSVLAASAVAGPLRQGAKQIHSRPAAAARPTTPPTGSPDGPGWSDNFDSYANGSGIIGQGGWEGWAGTVPAPNGFVSNAFASSGANSLRLAIGDLVTTQNTDAVHQYTATGGIWVYRIMTYMPSTAVAVTSPYFILLNSYQGGPGGVNAWSVQTHFNLLTNDVSEDTWMGGGVAACPAATYTNQPLITDQWVEVRAELDLSVTNGNVKIYYNNVLLADHCWVSPLLAQLPPYPLAAVDLYDDNIDVFYFDTASLVAGGGPTCYPNCDHSTNAPCLNVSDFGCFLNAFAAGSSYANCDGSTNIPVLTVQDFGCFLNAFAAGCGTNC